MFLRLNTCSRLLLLCAFCLLCACGKTPYTERSQLALISPAEEMQIGLVGMRDVKRNNVETTDEKLKVRVQNVIDRLTAQAFRPDFRWEVIVIESEVQNAFCMPGGKMAIYTGMIDIMDSDDEIAVVMGHEMGHALARHTAERFSQAMVINMGADTFLSMLDSGSPNPWAREKLGQILGLGVQYGVILPFSRENEYEADEIGLILTTKAGYNPYAGPQIWRKMIALHPDEPMEFMSTHPASEKRIKRMNEIIPDIIARYAPRQ